MTADQEKKELIIPQLSLVMMMGASGSGKSTFARKHFKETEILNSDCFRAMVGDDENDQTVTEEAFDVLKYLAATRLKLGRLTVIDATNLRMEDRQIFVQLARKYHCMPTIIVMNMPKHVCYERNRDRKDRVLEEHVIRGHLSQVRRNLRGLKREGFRHIHVLGTPEDAENIMIKRQPMWTDRGADHGPFDIIGDVHGCFIETKELLETLGYTVKEADGFPFGSGYDVSHPQGRKPVFLGDLVDRGPGIVPVLRLVMSVVSTGKGLCVPGNHDTKLVRKLRGKNVEVKFGLNESLDQLAAEPEEFHKAVERFLDKLVSHYVLDDRKLVVAHAGMKEDYQGRGSGRVREFALYGETTGETDEFGLPIRHDWAAEYRGAAIVVYGHTPVPRPEWLNRTINIDTGCVFGGSLTALRYPEKELVAVQAKQVYVESVKPFMPGAGDHELSLQQRDDDLLDLQDVAGKMQVTTALRSSIIIKPDYSAAALETMSRFAVNPKWLIYMPPTISPSESSNRDNYLEHPEDVFRHYAQQGVAKVVCEEKHMGSRAIVIICKHDHIAGKRFGVSEAAIGVCYTRTGRPFFNDPKVERELLERMQQALTAADFWETYKTDWFCLDCELMPWSMKAQELLKNQYAAVGSASGAALDQSILSLEQALKNGQDVKLLLETMQARREMTGQFITAYRQYCWPVNSVDDLKLAPFHLMASEGHVYSDKTHQWHMNTLSELCQFDPVLLRPTETRVIDLTDEAQIQTGIDWWLEMTSQGGEGMVIKPMDFIFKGPNGLVQPAIKCRGKEYLRIIYGPQYTLPQNLQRLRKRGLSTKRSLAIREFALGLESLQRFINKEPLRRVHECAFAVLALESEPVDPRL